MTDESGLFEATEAINSTLQEDGAGVELVGYATGVLSLRLQIKDETCSECLMPADVLEAVALKIAQRWLPSVQRVSLLDPRA